MREAKEDWLELGRDLTGRDLTSRGLVAPRLIVADGAPGLISATEEIWPRADRQHCAVHRLRNLQATLPNSEHDRIRFNYWSALNEATGAKDGKLRLQVVISRRGSARPVATGASAPGAPLGWWPTVRRRSQSPGGPYRRAAIERLLRNRGYRRLSPNPDEFLVYEHGERSRRVVVNPDWQPFYAGDAIFRTLSRDLAVSPEWLRELLDADHAEHGRDS